ncbi:MAG: aspartate-semialdehyde dehydrogenase [Bdellovibrionaceae bacterium]|nr:aspartate-semialdehyde dehydrogenase [Pseudobdellovibrionaceae bacterium]|tara:strand:- start:6866 stop:7885 length:1020 start_codon:yes stop_codon:yes gene_type:complete
MKIAILGATGAVGQVLLEQLEKRKFQFSDLKLLASSRSVGKQISVFGKNYKIEEVSESSFTDVDLLFSDVPDDVARHWIPLAHKAGCWVIDNSAAFRYETGIPIIVPEVNAEFLNLDSKILTNPNCSTAQLVVALAPLHRKYQLKRVVVSTYQSTSGGGVAAMNELTSQTESFLKNGTYHPPEVFTHPIGFNCIPSIGGLREDDYTSEEMKMIIETRKIMNLPDLKITATAVRVPTYACHGESVNVEFENEFELDELKKALSDAPGIEVLDHPSDNIYPMGNEAQGKDSVFIGRIRRDLSVSNGVNLWIVSDNLLKGAALNAVQVAECLCDFLSSRSSS